MNKEYLEALGKNIRYKKEYVGNDTYRLYIKKNEIELLENYLTELEQIKNANPSEALKIVDNMLDNFYEKVQIETMTLSKCNILTIKQTLIKAQEQEKVLEIIFKKTVGIFQLSCCKNVYEYNDLKFNDYEKLTQEEFDLVKRYCNEQI